MASCVTCHEGNFDQALAVENFTITTCKSCHPINGDPDYAEANRAPALVDVIPDWHLPTDDCTLCHQGQAGSAPLLSELHNGGFNPAIYDATGTKYSAMAANQVTITPALSGNVLDIKVAAGNAAIAPTISVNFYGYDTKQFLIAGHDRDGSNPGGSGLRLEYDPGAPGDTNGLFTTAADSVAGAWHVTVDLAAYVTSFGGLEAEADFASIPAMIAAGKIKKAEVVVMPDLDVGTTQVALDAPSVTLDLASNAVVDDYYKGAEATVSEAKCNACHDALATTFHSPDRGGNIIACKSCHVTRNGGSHLEMQSRGIDSYVHAIHSFQAFDTNRIDFTDPVEAARYNLHIEHVFPNFTIQNCKGCHVDGAATFNVPDQRTSMAGLLSGSSTWNVARNIGTVPSYLTGPASRACGSCHRADFIKEDAAGDLAAFNGHVETNGYLVEGTSTSVLYQAIDKIQSLFN
jgi:OmcA/MtrC family decaheme c-type cytochrome